MTEAAGATQRILPPYSPDFNPIEKAFSRLKVMLRKIGERTVKNSGTSSGDEYHCISEVPLGDGVRI